MLDPLSLRNIFINSQPSLCFVASKFLSKLKQACPKEQEPLWVELVKDPLFEGQTMMEQCQEQAETLTHLQLINYGKLHKPKHPLKQLFSVKSPDQITAISYTSGSTGVPKGAILTDELILPQEGPTHKQPFIRLDYQQSDPTSLLSLLSSMQTGGQRAFTSSLEKLMEDMRIVRPTHFGASPVFWNSLYQEYLFTTSFLFKQQNQNSDEKKVRRWEEIEEEVSSKMRENFGNRLTYVASG
eukprot:CAMPEP_0174278818 /NCGR_PEP_ID=MMETSP0439-20130205/61686_1 /TAXON_ID=0 /ORGANISM="Stereomyxa ramosa, Strain Chinc5" /LENGTH=240 /DNA_ID=CAMNT_0015371265 /DNA_START=758 /DNA_END=1477 /DNA_ORIENTATION=-